MENNMNLGLLPAKMRNLLSPIYRMTAVPGEFVPEGAYPPNGESIAASWKFEVKKRSLFLGTVIIGKIHQTDFSTPANEYVTFDPVSGVVYTKGQFGKGGMGATFFRKESLGLAYLISKGLYPLYGDMREFELTPQTYYQQTTGDALSEALIVLAERIEDL